MLDDTTPQKRTKFTLETGGIFSVLSSFFTVCAWSEIHIFQNLDSTEKMSIWNGMDELESSSNPDGFYHANAMMLICYLARHSYMMRDRDVARKWVDLRILEETPKELAGDLVEIRTFQMEREREVLFLPLLHEAAKGDSVLSEFVAVVNRNIDWIVNGAVE
jgi:hypothetical protein